MRLLQGSDCQASAGRGHAAQQPDATGSGCLTESAAMSVNLIGSTRLFPSAPYAYAAVAGKPGLIFTAGACPLDEHGQVTARGSRGEGRSPQTTSMSLPYEGASGR